MLEEWNIGYSTNFTNGNPALQDWINTEEYEFKVGKKV